MLADTLCFNRDTLLDGEDVRYFKDGYFITSQGRVFSTKTRKWLQTKSSKIKNNYPEFKINGIKTQRIHTIVAMLFLDKKEGCDYVNHIDGNKENNNVSNLEWVTFKQNMEHAGKTGLLKKDVSWKRKIQLSNRGKHSKISIDTVSSIFNMRAAGLTHQAIADVVGLSRQHIGAILNGKCWSYATCNSRKEQTWYF